MTGPGNRLAHAAAREMAQSAGSAFNPLVIHSPVGLGKTHLLEGIGHALLGERRAGRRDVDGICGKARQRVGCRDGCDFVHGDEGRRRKY